MKYPDRSIVYSRLYHIYQSIKQRCYYPKAISYKRYGAKGIVMCDLNRNIGRSSLVGKIVTLSGWLDLEKVEQYLNEE